MCPFCNKKNISELKLTETKHSLVICNKFPICEHGHFLVIPKRHTDVLSDLPIEEQNDLFILLSGFTEKVERAILPEGINVLFNRGLVAGQTIPHFHIHIICRSQNDGVCNIRKENGSRTEVAELQL